MKHGDICPKCSTKLEMHYTLSCPKCDKPEDVKTPRILDFFKVARYIATNEGYDDKWHRRVLDDMDIPGNDVFLKYWVETSTEDYDIHRCQMGEGLIKYFGFKVFDELLFEVSW